jgi:hypothetical protein
MDHEVSSGCLPCAELYQDCVKTGTAMAQYEIDHAGCSTCMNHVEKCAELESARLVAINALNTKTNSTAAERSPKGAISSEPSVAANLPSWFAAVAL